MSLCFLDEKYLRSHVTFGARYKREYGVDLPLAKNIYRSPASVELTNQAHLERPALDTTTGNILLPKTKNCSISMRNLPVFRILAVSY